MRTISEIRWTAIKGCTALVWLAAWVLAPGHVGAGQLVDSGNLLVNPGAESGSLDPWLAPGYFASDEPATLPAGTIDATGGDWWFGVEIEAEFTDDPPVDVIIFPTAMRQFPIDLTGMNGIESITIGADAFGVWEVLAGNPFLVRMDVLLSIFLLDEDGQPILDGTAGGSLITGFSMLQNPGKEVDFRHTFDLPEGVATIQFLANFSGRVDGSVGDHVQFTLGFDNLHVSVVHQIPEPSAFALLAFGGMFVLLGSARRENAA